MPLFELPEQPRYRLADAPLVQALAQVRFPLIAKFETLAGIAPLQDVLRGEFPYMEPEQVQEVSLALGSAGPAVGQAAQTVSWHLSNDLGEKVVVNAGSASLSVGESYGGIRRFSEQFSRVLAALEQVGVPRCDRLGVRYLSAIPGEAGLKRPWQKWIRSEVLGWSDSGFVSNGTSVVSINQIQVSHGPDGEYSGFPAAVSGVIRHGALPSGSTLPGIPPYTAEVESFFLDFDAFVEGAQRFAPDEIVKQFRVLHAEIDRFFYWCLTGEGRERFGLTIEPADS